MNKKVLISGYYGYGNFGDEAILGVLVDYLRKFNSEITVLSSNPEKTSMQYGISSVKNFDMLKVMSEISSCDVLISGGGSLLQDVTSLKSLLYYLFIINYAKFLKKTVIIFAQGIGPLISGYSKKLVLKTLSKCDIVTVRDIVSQDFLKANGIDAHIVSDPVFSVDLPIDQKTSAVGVQLRAFKSVDNAFLDNLARQIILNFGERKIELYVFQDSMDLEVCKNFEKVLKNIYPQIETEIVTGLSNNDIIMRISRLEYMIAMRFHAVLVAIKTGVKTLAINYDAKVAKLAYEAFLPMISISGSEDFEPYFDKLKTLKSEDILAFANTQHFEWNLFDEYLSK